MTFSQRYLNDAEPYTPEQLERLDRMFGDSLLAEQLIDLDELESRRYRADYGREYKK